MIVRELITRLGFNVNEGQLGRYERGVQNIKQSADGAAESFRNMFAAFLGFNAIQGIARTADEMQSLEARIGQLPQTITSAADGFDVVSARASAARQSIQAYGAFYVKLQQAGKDFIATQEEGLQVTDTISKALIVGGATAQEQSSALLQFGQAIGSGVLQGEELRALSEAAPQFLDELAKAVGIPRAELKKFASEGKLTSKVVIDGVKKMSVAFEQRFSQIPITIGQATQIINNRWGTFINRLNRESQAVTKIAGFFLKTFDKIEAGLADMVDFFGGATNTLKFFGIALAAALAPLAVKLFAGALAFIVSPLGLIIAGLLLLGLAIEDVYQWMTGGQSIIGGWLGEFSRFSKIFEGEFFKNFSTIVDGVLLLFSGVFNMVTGLFKIMIGFFKADFDMFYEGIAQLFGGLGEVVVGAGLAVISTFQNVVTVLRQIFETAFSTIKSIIINSIFGGIVDAVSRGWQAAKNLMSFGTISPTVAAGAASAPGGVPIGGGNNATQNITVNQTLPPGTPAETATAAGNATRQALSEGEIFSRQAAQAF